MSIYVDIENDPRRDPGLECCVKEGPTVQMIRFERIFGPCGEHRPSVHDLSKPGVVQMSIGIKAYGMKQPLRVRVGFDRYYAAEADTQLWRAVCAAGLKPDDKVACILVDEPEPKRTVHTIRFKRIECETRISSSEVDDLISKITAGIYKEPLHVVRLGTGRWKVCPRHAIYWNAINKLILQKYFGEDKFVKCHVYSSLHTIAEKKNLNFAALYGGGPNAQNITRNDAFDAFIYQSQQVGKLQALKATLQGKSGMIFDESSCFPVSNWEFQRPIEAWLEDICRENG